MQVREAMTPEISTVGPDRTIQDVAKLMAECDVGCMPIEEEGRLVGLITDRDIVVRAISRGLDITTEPVRTIMTADVHSVTPETSIEEAGNEMSRYKVRRLPVVENGKVTGMVSLGDLAVVTHDAQTCGSILEDLSSPRGPKCEAA